MKFKKYKNAVFGHFNRQKQNIGEIIEFELFYRFLAMILAQPVVSFLFHNIKKASNMPYFNFEALKSLTNKPSVLIWVFFIVLWMVLFASIEISGILMISYSKKDTKRLSFHDLIKEIGYDMLRLIKFRNLPMVFWIFFSFIFTGNISTFLKPISIPNFILIGIEERDLYIFIYMMFNIWILQLYIKRSFIFIIFFQENLDYKEALSKAKKVIKGNFFKVLLLLFLNGTFLTIVTDLSVTLITIISQSIVMSLENNWFLPVFLAIYRITMTSLPFFKSVIVVAGNLLVLQSLYDYYAKKNNIEIMPRKKILPNPRYRDSFLKNKRKIIIFGLCIYLIFFSFILYNSLIEGVDLGSNVVQITGHRGNGNYNPENIIPAMEQAFLSGADYVELDVQLTKDKVPILLHDKTFRRTTGVNKTPSEMAFEEVKKLDGGEYMSDEFKGANIPSLEEVIKTFRGRMKLNIELKPYGEDPKELSRVVAKVIKDNHFENQCIITSLNKECLEEVRRVAPDLEIGYIDIFFSGDLDKLGDYNAIILEESFVTSELIMTAHAQGRRVFVWTVNDPNSMDKLIRMGVDNIITDQVAVALSQRSYFEGTSITLKTIQKLMPNLWK